MSDHEDQLRPAGCADCEGPIGEGNGPLDGWQLEDGRTVCHACCVADTKRICAEMVDLARATKVIH